jgi:hypothetical protein
MRYGWLVSPQTVMRETAHLVPIFAHEMQKLAPIAWPVNPPQPFPALVHLNISGAIDCTSHYRMNSKYASELFYRGDKKGCFITAEGV